MLPDRCKCAHCGREGDPDKDHFWYLNDGYRPLEESDFFCDGPCFVIFCKDEFDLR